MSARTVLDEQEQAITSTVRGRSKTKTETSCDIIRVHSERDSAMEIVQSAEGAYSKCRADLGTWTPELTDVVG